MSLRRRRLRAVQASINSMPVDAEIERAAFQRFRETGELPDEMPIARAVIRRCKLGLHDRWGDLDGAALIRLIVEHGEPEHDEVLHRIYDEAVCGIEVVRMAARVVLRTLTRIGSDVTTSAFGGATLDDAMEFAGGVGLWLLGFPERPETPHAPIGE